jgi:hypothetical protein
LRYSVLVGCVVDFFGGGLVLWLILLLGHLLFRLKKDRTIPFPMICIPIMIHAIERSILNSTSASPIVCVASSRVVIFSSGVEIHVPFFWLQRSKFFLPILWWLTSI